MSVEKSTFNPPWDTPRFRNAYHYASLKKGDQAAHLINKVLRRKTQITWVDGGSGTGKSASFLAETLLRRGISLAKVLLVDRNQQALDRAFVQQFLRAKGQGKALQILSRSGDISDMPFLETAEVDLYTLNSVLEHLSPGVRTKSLAEARRVLSGEGVLQVIVPIASPLTRLEKWAKEALHMLPKGSVDLVGHIDHTHSEWFTAERVVEVVEKGGFRLVGEDYFVYGSIRPFWKVWIGAGLQSLLPVFMRKMAALSGIFVFQKSD